MLWDRPKEKLMGNFLSEVGAERPRHSILENTPKLVITEVVCSVDAEVFGTSLCKS